jgi:hypothetical protein
VTNANARGRECHWPEVQPAQPEPGANTAAAGVRGRERSPDLEGGTVPEMSALRLVKVPDAAPPYDCQVHGARCPARSAEAGPPAGVTLPAEPAPSTAVAPAVAGADPTTAWPRQLALVIIEVLAGVRPDRQLVPMTTDRVRARVRTLAPLLASDRRPRVQRVVASRPADRVAEITAVVRFGPRSRALAMRFEHVAARPATPGRPARPARWLCTAIEAG